MATDRALYAVTGARTTRWRWDLIDQARWQPPDLVVDVRSDSESTVQRRTLPADPRTVDLSEAERIVSGGFGVGGSSGMALLRRLAERMGAALGGTRVAADRGWLETDRFIGSTGKIVAPKLYIAFGVSGAGQHLAGITDSEWVVAINSDRTAPLLKRADLGVVGDLHQILPCLLDRLEAFALSEASSGGGLSDVATPALATTTDPTSRVAEISR